MGVWREIMRFHEGTRNVIILGVVVLLAALAAWGWMRKPATTPYANSFSTGLPTYGQPLPNQPLSNQQLAYDNQGRLVAANPHMSAQYEADLASAEGNPCVQPAMFTMGPAPMYASRDYVRTIRPQRMVVEERPQTVRYVERRQTRNQRSTGKSAAIVAGSAGAGAAIGGIAGGGKGAALGAVTGGVAGFVYDRLTHKR
jgi:hypothetical protein